MDGSATPANNSNKALTGSTTLKREALRLPPGANCKEFTISLDSDGNGIQSLVELHGIGIDYKILPIGNMDDGVKTN